MQKIVTFDELFEILGGDLPLSFYQALNKWHLKQMMLWKDKRSDEITKFKQANGEAHTLEEWNDEIASIRKFEFLLSKVRGKSDHDPYWPYKDRLRDILYHVRYIYELNEFDRDLFKNIPEPLSIHDRAAREFWLLDLYETYSSPIKNKQAREQIKLRLAWVNSTSPTFFQIAIKDEFDRTGGIRKAWTLRELITAVGHEAEFAAHQMWKSWGCAEGKGNAAEKAMLEYKRLGSFGLGE